MKYLITLLIGALISFGGSCYAENQRETLSEIMCRDVQVWNAPQAGGQIAQKSDGLVFRDTRRGEEMNEVGPPLWTASMQGVAPEGAYLEARVKAPVDVQFFIELVGPDNQSVATLPLQTGTGDWQLVRTSCVGSYGSSGSDLFVRAKKASVEGEDGIIIDRIGVYHGDWPNLIVERADRDRSERERLAGNLALARHGCYALSSSFADVDALYTDNAIDGEPSTIWRTWPRAAAPHWVELRWEYPLKIDQVRLVRPAPAKLTTLTLQRWDHHAWIDVQTFREPALTGDVIELSLEEVIETDRLRIKVALGGVETLQVGEVEVFGPPQPRVGKLAPYWLGHYIWYPEPDRQVKVSPRYFRRTFTINNINGVADATLQVRTNDGYIAYVNGHEVGQGSIDIRPIDVREYLQSGENCIALRAVVRKNPGWGLMAILAELTINHDDQTTTIGTDASWLCGKESAPGWTDAEFEEMAWLPACICATPPDRPWGRIPYFNRRPKRHIEIQSVEVTPEVARPGEDVRVQLKISPMQAFNQDYLFQLVAGESEINADRSNYIVAKTTARAVESLADVEVGASVKLEATLALPPYAPHGETPIRLRGLGLEQSGEITFYVDGRPIERDDTVAVLSVDRGLAIEGDRSDQSASVHMAHDNGVSRIVIQGKDTSPLLFALQSPSLDRFGKYSSTGIQLYHLQIYPYRLSHRVDYEKLHFRFVDQHIRHLLRIDPEAHVLVEMDLRSSSTWIEAHPDDRLLTAQGKPVSESFASEAYAANTADYVESLVRFLHRQPYSDRIIGYIPEIAEPESTLGGSQQNEFQSDRMALNIGDFNPAAIRGFRAFLADKYGTNEALQEAWQDDTVTLDSAFAADTPTQREALLRDLTAEGVGGGVFRDPSAGRMPYDYFAYLSTLVPTFVEQNVARVIKENSPDGALVGFYYGYNVEMMRSTNNPGALQHGNHFEFDRIVDSPYIDFFMSPLQYSHRRAGDRFFPFLPYASARLHDKLFVAELDLRTYLSGQVRHGRHHSEQETVAVLQNDLGTSLLKGSGAWFADWSSGSGHARNMVPFFDSPAMLDTISRFKELYDETLELPRTGGAEIAVVVHPRAMYYHDVRFASVIYYNLITRMLYEQMPYLGTPFDIYTIDDLGDPRVRDQYKLFVLLNPYHLTTDQRRDIDALKSDGRTLLTFYAPGYVDDQRGLTAEGVAEVTGMEVGVNATPVEQSAATVRVAHPILRGIPAGTVYEAEGYDYNPRTAAVHPTAFGPQFFVNDPHAQQLATDEGGRTAWAARDFGEWKSVYTAVPYLDTAALRNIADWAGVHLYTEPGIVVEANDQFLLLHNGFDQGYSPLRVSLPRRTEVHELLDDLPFEVSGDAFEVDLPECTTLFFRLRPE